MGEKDITEKILEDYNDVFADIVNTLVFEGEETVKSSELENVKDKSMYKADGKIHEQERDVVKKWKKENELVAMYAMENQTQPDNDMALRIMGYDGASYRNQLKEGKDRYPVCTLVLNFGTKPWKKETTLHHGRKFYREELKEYCSDYRYKVVDIRELDDKAIGKFQSDFGPVVDYLVNGTKEDYMASSKELKHPDEVLKFLSVITQDKIYETETMKGASKMCDIANKFIAKGRSEGMTEGITQGITQERVDAICRMVNAQIKKDVIFGMGYTEKEYEKAQKLMSGEV